MAVYTPKQLELYFKHIRIEPSIFDGSSVGDQLQNLTRLQQHHLARIPFDSVALHYSPTRLLSLDHDGLFQKIVINSRGGYCMEVNTLFGSVLRSLGYTVISVGGRVKHMKWSHMVNIVTIAGSNYLVDVGFGAKEPIQPVPLKDGHEFTGLLSITGRLDLKHLEKHSTAARSDPSQRLWVYSVRSDALSEWEEMYSFTETEFFPEDFAVMSYYVSTSPHSWFVQEVVAYRMLMDEGKNQLVGEVALHGNVLKTRLQGQNEDVRHLRNEKDRIKSLADEFGISLTEREQRAIVGLASEIKRRE
ncbi:hypothetical protein N0V93_008841 [Gnomoniopsis smithogilvyi]|uniref:Arylamine N-acetyltransferase n=1 Tax=Gnomoniopsis smithogilvyi TaxID=1191159 RepID=A0A9W9CV96_9PEZI|nr:hypothetical protein N0V93_008841 [Gnomoniopsis smithogilvyi]